MLNPLLTAQAIDDRLQVERRRARTIGTGPVGVFGIALGNTVRLARWQAGLSQAEVGDAIALDRSAISRWECGLRMPTLAHLVAFGELVGCAASVFVAEAERAVAVATGAADGPSGVTYRSLVSLSGASVRSSGNRNEGDDAAAD